VVLHPVGLKSLLTFCLASKVRKSSAYMIPYRIKAITVLYNSSYITQVIGKRLEELLAASYKQVQL